MKGWNIAKPILVALACLSGFSACKLRSEADAKLASGGPGRCIDAVNSRTTSLGFRVRNGAGGAEIVCVESNLGVHTQYDLRVGDVIIGLNHGVTVASAPDLEIELHRLEANFDDPIDAFAFVVVRGEKRINLNADPGWIGCVPESPFRCGSAIK